MPAGKKFLVKRPMGYLSINSNGEFLISVSAWVRYGFIILRTGGAIYAGLEVLCSLNTFHKDWNQEPCTFRGNHAPNYRGF